MFVFQDAVQSQFRRFTPILLAFFFYFFSVKSICCLNVSSARKRGGLLVSCCVYKITKVFFFTKGTTEDVLMHVSCHLALAVNKSDCCLIRVTPSECDSLRYSSLMDQVLNMCLMGCLPHFSFTALVMNRRLPYIFSSALESTRPLRRRAASICLC